MIDATAIVLTKNEELNLVDCLLSIKDFAKRIVVIDSGSTDRTCEIATLHGAEVYHHQFEYYAKQFNWGIDNINIDTAWIIRIDADERFTPSLCDEVKEIIQSSNTTEMNGVMMEADLFFLGRQMKRGIPNKRKMMMFRTGIGRIEDRRRDAHSVIEKGICETTKNRFIHYDFKNLTEYIKRYNWYATREMQDYIEYTMGLSSSINTHQSIQKLRSRKFNVYYKAPRYFRAFLWFTYNYVLRRGFLDGREGLIFCFFECCWYRLLVDAKIFEYEKTGGQFEVLKAID